MSKRPTSLPPRPVLFDRAARRRRRSASTSRRGWLRSTIAVLCLLMCSLPEARAQQTTERFIPIGQSPGLSGQHTVIGAVSAVDLPNRVVTVTDESGSYTAQVTERTDIWLDRSTLKASNLRGTAEDVREGVRVEVKYENNERNGPAEWIKVQVTEARDGG